MNIARVENDRLFSVSIWTTYGEILFIVKSYINANSELYEKKDL